MPCSTNRTFPTSRCALRALLLSAALLAASTASAATDAARDLGQGVLFAAHEQGAGRDLVIAVYEPGACVDRDHPAFEQVHFLPRLPSASCDERGSGGAAVLSHSTKVASALAGVRWDRDYTGLFGGTLIDADSSAGTWEDLIASDPDFINLSRTIAPINAYAIDAAVYANRIFVANGAGNDGTNESDRTRCFAYNSVCVGGYLHEGSLGPGSYYDDRHAGAASWRNSPQSGREEPDLVGPFRQALAVSGGQYELEGGTSYATPSVIGLAALLTANFPDTLQREPTLMRALLMASASHRVLDPETPWFGAPVIGDAVDDRSGAGAPRGDRAEAIVQGGRTFAKSIDHEADVEPNGRLRDSITLSVSEDAIVRVALAWDQCPIQVTEDADVLTVDLDLKVRGPGISLQDFESGISEVIRDPSEGSVPNPFVGLGSGVGETWIERLTYREILVSNPSRVDNYELVEFRAPVGGEYRIEVDSVRWDACPYDGLRRTNVALAWDVSGGQTPLRPQLLVDDGVATPSSGVGSAPMWSPDFGYGQGYRIDVHPRHLADVNGDGRDDVVAFANRGAFVALANGYGFETTQQWSELHGLNSYGSDAIHPRHLADVNGDGMADIVQFSQFGTWVSLSTGSGFAFHRRWSESFGTSEGYTTTDHIRLIEDVNGDGLGDIVSFANRGVYVALSAGQFFGAVERWSSEFGRDVGGWSITEHLRTLADVNADGYLDIVGFGKWGVYVALSTGSGFQASEGWLADFGNSAGGWHPSRHPRFVKDVTGDGLPEIVGIGEQGVSVSVGTGTGFGAPSLWLAEFGPRTGGWTVGVQPRFVEDVDGDGRADVVGLANNGVYLATSVGNDFLAAEKVNPEFGSATGWTASAHPRGLADPDGDGVLEVVGFFDVGTRVGQIVPEEPVIVPEPNARVGLLSGLAVIVCVARRRGRQQWRRWTGSAAAPQPMTA